MIEIKKEETGRSMIEMLGVLAVIGVLSVGGIAGYTSAMNKHRANELLNEASKRAVVCVAQISAGNTPSVSDFGDYDGYSFTAAANPSNANQFQLTISGKDIPEAVCKNMKNTVGSSTPIRNINAGCTVITYNNDMGTTVYNSDYNGDPDHCPGKYCTGSDTCVDTGANCTCSGTIAECKVCDTDTGSIVNATDGTECTGGTCQSGSCVATPSCATSGPCTSNEGLCPDYYCKVGGYCDWDIPGYIVTSGDIKPLPSTATKDTDGYHKGEKMTWDAAYYYCQALNARGDNISGMAGTDNNNLPKDNNYWLDSLAGGDDACTASYALSGYAREGDRNNTDTYALCE